MVHTYNFPVKDLADFLVFIVKDMFPFLLMSDPMQLGINVKMQPCSAPECCVWYGKVGR